MKTFKHGVLLNGIYLLAMTQLSCSKNEFPRYSALDRLRLLAIVADTPELQNPSAGTVNVQITPYFSDLGGTGDIQLEVQSCLDPGVSLGAPASCTNGISASILQTVTVTSAATSTAGLFGEPERTGAPQSGATTVPLQIPPNLLDQYSPSIRYNGFSYLITVKATSTTSTVTSFRRILISNKTANINPTLTDLVMDNSTLTQTPTAGIHTLTFSTSDTPESYQFLKGNGDYRSLQEDYELTWFASDGILENFRTKLGESIDWEMNATNPTPTPSHKPVVVGVLRDGRGGVTVKVKTLTP